MREFICKKKRTVPTPSNVAKAWTTSMNLSICSISFFNVVVSLYSRLVWRFLCNLINMHSSGFSRCSASMSSTVAFLKAYVQGARGLNCYPLFRPLYTFGLDACLYREKLK
jgi:hypothetical protein